MSKELIKIANELSNKDMCDLINIFSEKIQVSFQLSKERPCSLNGACLQLNSEWTDTEDCLIPINEWIKD